jgi:uncharacterized cupredoxin-like copper-binding protein
MVKRAHIVAAAGIVVTSAAAIFATEIGMPIAAFAHEDRGHFSAGEPGDPKKPARTIKVIMREDGKKMAFDPARITVRKGEQIRFVLENDGTDDHEFVLATAVENRKHAELMKKFPDMEHDDPNAKRLAVGEHGEILWKFTKAGTFEFACLIPGHREAGMLGKVIVR